MMDTASIVDARRQWAQRQRPADGNATPLLVGVAASFTAHPLEPFLGVELLSGTSDPAIVFADHNQLHQTCLDPTSTFGVQPDRLVLLWRLEDVFEADLLGAVVGDADAGKRLLDSVGQLVSLMAQCAEREHVPMVVGIPPTPAGLALDPLDTASSTLVGDLHARAVALVIEALSAVDAIRLVDHRRIVEQIGTAGAHDERGSLLYRQPYRPPLSYLLGIEVAKGILSFDRPPPKAVVVDADNTLWSGIIGEDGISGIGIGGAYPGNAFSAFQLALQRLARRGVLLALCSKNNPAEVDAVFADRAEMVLRPEDFASIRVNWEPKSANIASIAAELNIGLDSVVFIDDSEYELAEVRAALPEVRCLRVPEELAELPDLLASTGWFRYQRVSAEDSQRTLMMRQERERDVARTAISPEEFLASLDLRVTFTSAGPEHVGRVTQLINKTNQFNLTTRRRTEAEVSALIGAGDARTFVVEVDDRFGSYGLVGVAIATGVGSSSWELDTLLMSCRVLGRGVETAFLAAIVSAARAAGATTLVGRFVPTAKNEQVRNLYRDHGFRAEGADTFVLALTDSIAVPRHIRLATDA
jgi:FkbH-like protein